MKHLNKYKIIKFLVFIILVISSCIFINSDFLIGCIKNNIIDKYSYNSKFEILNTNSILKSFNKVNGYVNNIKENYNINNSPIIYIYNSHEDEKYFLPFINDYSIIPNVKIASYMLKDNLNKFNISSYVEDKSIKEYLNKNNLDYKGCYEASRYYLKEAQKKYNFTYYIDLHRDSVKRNATLYTKDNTSYAKIMFVVTTKHKNYEKNLEFVNELNKIIQKNYKGLSRGIYKRDDVIFNQDLSDKAILIELGGVDNTIDEINNSLYVLASAFNEYILNGE